MMVFDKKRWSRCAEKELYSLLRASQRSKLKLPNNLAFTGAKSITSMLLSGYYGHIFPFHPRKRSFFNKLRQVMRADNLITSFDKYSIGNSLLQKIGFLAH